MKVRNVKEDLSHVTPVAKSSHTKSISLTLAYRIVYRSKSLFNF